MFPLVLLGGLAALMLIAGAKTSHGSPRLPARKGKLPPDVAARMNQAIASKDGEAWVASLGEVLRHGDLRDQQVRMAADMLLNLINQNQPKKTVTAGRSGTQWQLQVVKAFDDGTVMRDVFTPSGSRVVRFEQDLLAEGMPKHHVDHPPSIDASILSRAMQDFQVRRTKDRPAS